MRAGDKLHFSPKYIFARLDFENRRELLRAFKDRIYGFYLDPAKLLDRRKFGFGCGLLCVAIIDSLARVMFPEKTKVGERIAEWLKDNIDEFKKEDFAIRFYEDFRCGLVHEGRIKNPGEFSYESTEIVSREDDIIRINPSMLLRKIEEAFEKYLVKLKKNPDAFNKFEDRLKKDFGEEAERERGD